MSMVNERTAPEIRVDGFTKPWESGLLGNIMEITSVKRIHQSDWTDRGVRFIRARDIVAIAKGEEVTDLLYISRDKYDEYSALSGKVKVGDLLVTGVGSIGVPMLIENDEPLYFKDGNVIWFRNNSFDGRFFYYSFRGESIQKYIRDVAGVGTVGTYTIDSGKKTPIQFPTAEEEQATIGNFFRDLDDTITLKKQQHEQAVNIKKAMLEKMFPKKGADVPEIRFEGFVRNWEVKRLDGLADIGDGLHGTPKYDNDGEYYFINGNNLNNGRIIITSETKRIGGIAFNKIRIDFNENTIFMSINGTIGNVGFWNNEKIALGKSVAYFNINEIIMPQFAFYVLQTNPLLAYFNDSLTGTTIKNLGLNAIRSAKIIIPDLAEQTAIGNFFCNLDTLIEAQQEELKKLQNIKSACLSKMFV